MNKVKDILFGALLTSIVLFGCSHVPPLQETPKESLSQEKVEAIDFSDDESMELTELPFFKQAWSLARHEDKIPPAEIASALGIFYSEWDEKYGDPDDKLWDVLNDLTITWGHELMPIKNCYDVAGNHIDEGHASGLTSTNKTIWVFVEDKTLSNTSLIHELIHVALWTLQPDTNGDADHEGIKYPGWTKEHTAFIEQVNKKLKATGL